MRVRTFTGAWIETVKRLAIVALILVRTFTGAWIETGCGVTSAACAAFAPSRVRGLKLSIVSPRCLHAQFAPSRVRGLKLVALQNQAHSRVRTFTGAWIETLRYG